MKGNEREGKRGRRKNKEEGDGKGKERKRLIEKRTGREKREIRGKWKGNGEGIIRRGGNRGRKNRKREGKKEGKRRS